MTYYIKISGIDNNQNFSKYIPFVDSDDNSLSLKPYKDIIIEKKIKIIN